jgi:alpha-L-arabinofuranosidase
LANAGAIMAIERDGRIPIATSANCLQPDGQNDNDWNQGLLFLNPSQVWLQPPGYVTRMVSAHYQPLAVAAEVVAPQDSLEVSSKRSEDGRVLVLQVVNYGEQPVSTILELQGFSPREDTAGVQELMAPLHAVNTSDAPNRVRPYVCEWRHGLAQGEARFTFSPHAFTVIRFE